MPPAVVPPSLAAAKARARRACGMACDAEPRSAALYSQWWSETLLAVEHAPADRAIVMLQRCAVVFEISVDRLQWPGTIRGFAR